MYWLITYSFCIIIAYMSPVMHQNPTVLDAVQTHNKRELCWYFNLNRNALFDLWCNLAPQVWSKAQMGISLELYSGGNFNSLTAAVASTFTDRAVFYSQAPCKLLAWWTWTFCLCIICNLDQSSVGTISSLQAPPAQYLPLPDFWFSCPFCLLLQPIHDPWHDGGKQGGEGAIATIREADGCFWSIIQ